MTVAFTSIMAIFIIERIDERKGTVSIIPLVLAGIISIVYWRQAHCFFRFAFFFNGIPFFMDNNKELLVNSANIFTIYSYMIHCEG